MEYARGDISRTSGAGTYVAKSLYGNQPHLVTKSSTGTFLLLR